MVTIDKIKNVSDEVKKNISEKEEQLQRETNEWNETFKRTKDIRVNEKGDIDIVLDDDEIVNVKGNPQEINLNIDRCVMCGKIGVEGSPLFTFDHKTFICKHCSILAFKAYIENGYNMPTTEEMKTNEKFNAYIY